MKWKSNNEKMKSMRIMVILLLIFNCLTPIIFTWIVELITIINPNVYLTNGFFEMNPIQTYHLTLYLMLFSTIFTSMFALFHLDLIFPIKVERGKDKWKRQNLKHSKKKTKR